MTTRKVRFNRVAVGTMTELRNHLEAPMSAAQLLNRDFCPSWENVASEPEEGGTRWLLRSSEGGLAWVHLDGNDMAHDATRIADEEARELWARLILQFTPKEVCALESALRPGEILEDALKTGLGFRRKVRSIFLNDKTTDDGTTMRRCLVRNGGIVCAWVNGSDDSIVRSKLITGEKAWSLVQHFIDP